VRGAPAIGIAGAYGVYLGLRKSKGESFGSFLRELNKVTKRLASSRPTARNLFWALERIKNLAIKNKDNSISRIKALMLKEAHLILAEDKKICREIGRRGAKLIRKGSRILTHCNAGALATADYGTALGVIFKAKKKIKMVYADETRPWLQGARLTVWELAHEKVPTTLICDNMAASRMAKKEIDAVIVGADRIASNGDTANKIGTYNLAIAANYHGVPFYVASPVSTFDLNLKSGDDITIEERSPEEVRKIGSRYITSKNVKVKNPAFDITPAKLIEAIITEKGIIEHPNRRKIKGTI